MQGAGRPRAARGGFTLIELLVVITIILIVSAVALPTVLPALSHRQVSEAARTVQAVLAGARDAAIRDNSSSGIRLLPDPQFNGIGTQYLADGVTANPYYNILDPTQPLAYNRIIPIESAPEYSEGLLYTVPVTSTSGLFTPNSNVSYSNTGVPYPLSNGGGYYPTSVLTVYEAVYGSTSGGVNVPNPPTNWFWNIRVGDQIQFNNAGPWYTIVGPMVVDPTQGNPEMFVNVGPPGANGPISFTANNTTYYPDFLFLVNGQDDNANGWVDEGWDGVDNNLVYEIQNKTTQIIDDVLEWGAANQGGETEAWLGTLLTSPPKSPIIYTIRRRPTPVVNAREVSLPSGVVIDASSWGVTNERTRVPVGAFNIYSGIIDIMLNPDGSAVPTTIYSSPSSVGLFGAFYHFWLAERGDVYAPTFTTSNGVNTGSLVSPYQFALPMPTSAISQAIGSTAETTNAYGALLAANPSLPYLKGEMRIVTLYSRTGQVTTNESPTFNVNNTNQPFWQAQLGVSGGQE